MAAFPKFPLWTDAYLGDTTHLSTLEHGAYLLLLIAMWRSKFKSLPNDDKLLARYTHLTPSRWRKIKPVILAFFDVSDEVLTQARLSDEFESVKQHSLKQSNNARHKHLKRNEPPPAVAKPNASQNDAPLPSPKEVSKTLMSELEKANIQHFEAFWKLYPSRGKHSNPKHPAMRKYLEAIKTTSFEEINKGAENYALSVKGEEQRFVAQAATWLNQKRWGDYQVGPKPRAHQGVYD